MRRAHHAALRACPGLLPALHRLLQPGARGWTELKAAVSLCPGYIPCLGGPIGPGQGEPGWLVWFAGWLGCMQPGMADDLASRAPACVAGMWCSLQLFSILGLNPPHFLQAKKILTNLGELEDTNRPLLTLSPAQLRALLEGQGIDVSRQWPATCVGWWAMLWQAARQPQPSGLCAPPGIMSCCFAAQASRQADRSTGAGCMSSPPCNRRCWPDHSTSASFFCRPPAWLSAPSAARSLCACPPLNCSERGGVGGGWMQAAVRAAQREGRAGRGRRCCDHRDDKLATSLPKLACAAALFELCRELGGLGQSHRLLRVLRAHEAFSEIDACGELGRAAREGGREGEKRRCLSGAM